MEKTIIKNPELVVALDIGSTYCGYAWQWRQDFLTNKGNVEFNTDWGTGAIQLHKTNSCLLMDKDQKVLGFGYAAEKKFCQLSDEHGVAHMIDNYRFFKHFKHLLYKDGVTKDTIIEDYNHNRLPLFDVMSKLIGELKEHFLEKLKDRGHNIQLKTTLFVVTVPALWPDKSKRFMRDAALKCGIKDENLLIAIEPEAAALFCLQLPMEQRQAMNNFGFPGDKFLAVDLGGCTADITAIEVLEDGYLNELYASTGNMTGGQDINNAFFQHCTDVFEGNAWRNTFCEKSASLLLEMEEDFERQKITIGSDSTSDVYIKLRLPSTMLIMLLNEKIKLREDEFVKTRFKTDQGIFSFRSDFIRNDLFGQAINMIIDAIDKIFKTQSSIEIRTILLVGGFSESKYVVRIIREHITHKHPGIQVVVPSSPSRAVIHGAVLYGHDPMIFRSRIAKATYGIKTNRLFDSEKHDESKKWKNKETDKYYCKDIFDVHVTKDQSVRLNNPQPSQVYVPMYEKQTSLNLSIYTSTDKNPRYTTDSGCKKLAEIDVDMSDTTGGTKREVSVTMIYGGTELAVVAKNVKTDKEYKVKLRFDDINN